MQAALAGFLIPAYGMLWPGYPTTGLDGFWLLYLVLGGLRVVTRSLSTAARRFRPLPVFRLAALPAGAPARGRSPSRKKDFEPFAVICIGLIVRDGSFLLATYLAAAAICLDTHRPTFRKLDAKTSHRHERCGNRAERYRRSISSLAKQVTVRFANLLTLTKGNAPCRDHRFLPLYSPPFDRARKSRTGASMLPGSIHVVEEPGTLGNPTPQMVTEQCEVRGRACSTASTAAISTAAIVATAQAGWKGSKHDVTLHAVLHCPWLRPIPTGFLQSAPSWEVRELIWHMTLWLGDRSSRAALNSGRRCVTKYKRPALMSGAISRQFRPILPTIQGLPEALVRQKCQSVDDFESKQYRDLL